MSWFGPVHRTVATIGYPGHGKTIFLASLFWDSFFALSETFHDERRPYAVRAVTEEAIKLFFGNAEMLHRRHLPPPNPRSQPEPAVLEFRGVPCSPAARRPWRAERSVVRLTFYDIAGEVFRDATSARRFAPFLAEADDLVFLFDPTRPDFSVLSAAQLVNVVSLASDGGRKNVILALSKVDALRAQDEWVEVLTDLWPDRPPRPEDLPRYLKEMEILSDRARDWWTDGTRRATNLVHSLPEQTRYCVLSALGHAPAAEEGEPLRLTGPPEPFRVRDPLFWIFRAAGVM